MKAIPFVKPSIELCDQFRNLIAPIFRQLRAATEQSRTLIAIRDALLPKLISGEIQVGDTEQFLAKVIP